MKYAGRDFPCIGGYIRPGKASLSETRILNLLIRRHKSAPNLQGTKPAVWLAVRAVCCQPVSPGFLRKFREKNRGKIARVQGPVCGRLCGRMQAYNFLPDSCSCMECSCVERTCGRSAGHGYCQGVGNRPDRLSAAPVQTGHRRPPVHTAPRSPPGGPSLHKTAD